MNDLHYCCTCDPFVVALCNLSAATLHHTSFFAIRKKKCSNNCFLLEWSINFSGSSPDSLASTFFQLQCSFTYTLFLEQIDWGRMAKLRLSVFRQDAFCHMLKTKQEQKMSSTEVAFPNLTTNLLTLASKRQPCTRVLIHISTKLIPFPVLQGWWESLRFVVRSSGLFSNSSKAFKWMPQTRGFPADPFDRGPWDTDSTARQHSNCQFESWQLLRNKPKLKVWISHTGDTQLTGCRHKDDLEPSHIRKCSFLPLFE